MEKFSRLYYELENILLRLYVATWYLGCFAVDCSTSTTRLLVKYKSCRPVAEIVRKCIPRTIIQYNLHQRDVHY